MHPTALERISSGRQFAARRNYFDQRIASGVYTYTVGLRCDKENVKTHFSDYTAKLSSTSRQADWYVVVDAGLIAPVAFGVSALIQRHNVRIACDPRGIRLPTVDAFRALAA